MDSSTQNTDIFLKLQQKITQASLPSDLKEKLQLQLERLQLIVKTSGFRVETEKELQYLEFVSSLPFNGSSQDVLDIKRAAQILDQHHYGLQPVKDKILEYLAMLILNSRQSRSTHSRVLAFVGLAGSGKTSLAYSIAESLGRKIVRIPFGGLGSVRELRGESRTRPEAEPGRIMKAITQIGVNNPVILLDELDRVSVESRSDVMGVLVELLDPEQNNAFLDHYVDYPFNLSKVLFIATANNTANIATAVLDRLELVEMPSYTDEEKMVIGKSYLLPKAITEAGIPANLILFDDAVWPQIVRPLGFDAGIRSLQRNIYNLVGKVARKVVEGRAGTFKITSDNIGEFIG